MVYFVDEEYEISRAEQLAQIDHQSRRNWACNIVEYVRSANINVWPAFDLGVLGNCSFNQRLTNENWIDPTTYTGFIILFISFTKQNFEDIHHESQILMRQLFTYASRFLKLKF